MKKDRSAVAGKPVRQALAWGVHFYTGLGLVCAAGMAVLIFEGGAASFRAAFWLMFLATFIDATDGTLARQVRVKEVLPGFDGRRLDDLVDFLTYVCLPLLLIWRAGLLPAGMELCLLLPLMAAGYGFSQVSAKTDDGYWLGFPSCWNLVAFYLYALQPLPGEFSLGVLIVLSVLTFVPSRYLYPSMPGRLNRLTSLLGAFWAVLLGSALWQLTEGPGGRGRDLAVLSLFFPIYYFAVSWAITLRRWQVRRPRREEAPSPLASAAAADSIALRKDEG